MWMVPRSISQKSASSPSYFSTTPSTTAFTDPVLPVYTHKPNTVLVAGAAGGLGKHIINMLLHTGVNKVIAVDAAPKALHHRSQGKADKVVFVQGNITEMKDQLSRIVHDHRVDCIISSVMPNLFTATEQEFTNININAVKTLLDVGKSSKSVSSFVYISSIAVMNHFTPSINTKESDPLPSMDSYYSPYDRTKRIAEDMVLATNGFDNSRLRTIALRPGGIIADAKSPTVKDNLQGNVIYWLGVSAVIDHAHGIDIAHAVGCALNNLHDQAVSAPVCAGKAYFVTGHAVDVGDIAQLVGKYRGNIPVKKLSDILPPRVLITASVAFRDLMKSFGLSPAAICLGDFMKMSTIQQTFNNKLAKDHLKWQPLLPFEEGIRLVVKEKLEGERH